MTMWIGLVVSLGLAKPKTNPYDKELPMETQIEPMQRNSQLFPMQTKHKVAWFRKMCCHKLDGTTENTNRYF